MFAAVGVPAAWGDTHSTQIEQQRALFKSIIESVERGDWAAVDDLSALDRQLLEQYILWPDLRATWLRANIDSVSAAEVDSYLQQHGALRPARELRYRYSIPRASSFTR